MGGGLGGNNNNNNNGSSANLGINLNSSSQTIPVEAKLNRKTIASSLRQIILQKIIFKLKQTFKQKEGMIRNLLDENNDLYS
jgi:hypothetical protein